MKTPLFFITLFLASSLIAQPAPLFDSLTISYSDTLYFSSGSDELSATELQKVVDFPSPTQSTDQIYLTGHTDNVGNDEYNDALAKRRAQNAKEQLLKQGWLAENILIRTFGEHMPVALNKNDDGRLRNRRVTIDYYESTPYVKVNGQATDPAGNSVQNAKVRLHGRSISDTLNTDQEGQFTLNLPVDSIVGIDIYAKGYFLSTQLIRVKPQMPENLKIEVIPAEIGAIADIANFYFVGNRAILLPQSEPELPKLKLFMQINPHLVIEIAGHVNLPNSPPIAEDNPSWDLSLRRAKMVYDYLIAEGIPAEQLSYKPYGNHEMRYPKAKLEKYQAANRRVEIRVIGKLQNK